MKNKFLVRMSIIVFLFTLGYLVGGGLSKTVAHLTAKNEKKAVMRSSMQ